MSVYSRVTIHTLINLGDGTTSYFDNDGNVTETANLARLVETILQFGYPSMTFVHDTTVSLNKQAVRDFFKFDHLSGTHHISTFSFTCDTIIDQNTLRDAVNTVPVVIPTASTNKTHKNFITFGPERNTTIIVETFQ